MSRVRTGHGPADWSDNVPGAARVASKAFSVQAEVIGAMRPIVTFGGSYMDSNSLTAAGGWRKDSDAKYRNERKAS